MPKQKITPENNKPVFIESCEVAKLFGLKKRTFTNVKHIISAKHELAPVRMGRKYFYRVDQVEAIIEKIIRTGDRLY